MHSQRARRSAPAQQLLIPLLVGWALTAQVQAATPVQAELNGSFHEVVQEEVSVSGTVVVGVAAAGALSGPATLAGLIIPTSAGQICLTVLSRDGVYYSRNSYRVPEGSPTEGDILVQLPFEGTQRRELLVGYSEGELAVLATPGACDDAATTYLVAGGPRFHGVFAPNCKHREHIVPRYEPEQPELEKPLAPMTWMQRLKRVFAIDIETCPKCGGKLRVIACIEDPDVIAKIPEHIRTREAAEPLQPRAPPHTEHVDTPDQSRLFKNIV